MKVRGTIKVTKDIIAPNTGSRFAEAGLYGKTDDTGTLQWDDLSIPTVDVNKNYSKASLILDNNGDAFISIVDNANGGNITDPLMWVPFGGSTTGCDCVSTKQIGPYPIGTKLEDIILACCYPNDVRNLVLSGYGDTIPANTDIVNPSFAWQVAGNPTNVRLSDNVGILTNVDVTGLTSYTSSVTYNYGDGATVLWTITSAGGSTATDSIKWVAPVVVDNTYYSLRGATLGTPNEAEILAGTIEVIPSTSSLKVLVGVSFANENLFIAVPITQIHTFDKFNTDPSATPSAIGADGSFTTLEDKGIVQVNGADYHVYATAYATGSGDPSFGVEISI